jgi:hypothetical protein
MTAPTKSPSLQAFRLALYRRALHPENFDIKGRRAIMHGDYEFEAWVMPGSHLLRFQHEGFCGTEHLTDAEIHSNDRGLVTDIPCAGEKDHEHQFSDAMNYMVTVQTESLPANLYSDTYEELVEFGIESDALMHRWEDSSGGKCASILDTQRFRREVHAQAYHLFATGGIVIRSQTLFEHS